MKPISFAEISVLAQFGRKIITLYWLVQKLQIIPLNAPKTTNYDVMKMNFQKDKGFIQF
jgi:hypothetical protein